MEVVREKLERLVFYYKRMVTGLFLLASTTCVWFLILEGDRDKVPPDTFSYIFSNEFFLLAVFAVLIPHLFKETIQGYLGNGFLLFFLCALFIGYTSFGNGWVTSFITVLACWGMEIAARMIGAAAKIFFVPRKSLRKGKGEID